MNQKTKQIIIAIVIIIVAFLGFKFFFPSAGSPDSALTAQSASSAQFVDGQTILASLGQLNKVTLDESIFTNKIFASLISFSVPIQDQAIGRQNPFSPIGVDSSAVILPRGTSTVQAR
jgi:hypothetical protein